MTKQDVINKIKLMPHTKEYEALFTTNIFGEIVQRSGKDIIIKENGDIFVINTSETDNLLDSFIPSNDNFSKMLQKSNAKTGDTTESTVNPVFKPGKLDSEKLAWYRSKKMLLDPKYERLAVIGDKRKAEEEKKEKSLSIKYLSCSADDINYNLTFEIVQTNMINSIATIYVTEMNAENEEATRKSVKLSDKKNNIIISFSKNLKFENHFWQKGFSFQATIVSNGISAKTDEFELKCLQNTTSTKTCFCNRNFTVDEFKNIIIELRKREVLIPNDKMVRDKNGNPILKNGKKQYVDYTTYDAMADNLFSADLPEKIRKEDSNFKKFTEVINKTLKDYDINTCIRKIYFLAQCYHETQRFDLTYEKNPSSTVSGGPFYRGRGLIHLTHDYNYEKLKNKLKANVSLTEFVPRVAKEIDLACQASGYYWKNLGIKRGNINLVADEDDILTVSKEVNGYGGKNGIPNGFNDRKVFTDILKKVMHYDQCKNKK